jgi:hypothetical protein
MQDMNMTKYIIGVVVLVVAGAAGFLIWQKASQSIAQTPEPEPAVQMPPAPVTHTYASSTFSIVYPDGYTADDTYKYQGVPKKPIPGVKFVIPGTMATGTNLSVDSGVSVESLPRAKSCTGDIYIYQNVKAHDVTVGANVWSVASTSDAGAGNLYEEQVYALKGSAPCLAVRYYIHTTNIENYPPGTVQAFNRDALMADFDKIRDSLQIGAPQPVGTTTAPATSVQP